MHAGRIVGVDVTRGLAVLGMAAAHVGAAGEAWSDPVGWLQVADGRSAATFATLAGVSAGLLSGAGTPHDLPVARARVAARALLIGVLGLVLMALGTPVVVILPSYAVMFLLLVPVLGARPSVLAVLAAVVVVVGAAVHVAVVDEVWARTWPISLAVGPYYPVVVWTGYLLAGLALVRAGLLAHPGRLAALGAGLGVLGYGTGALAAALGIRTLGTWADLTPHSSTAPEVVGNLGVALLVLSGALALAPRSGRLLAPLAATGALALTAYTGQVIAIALMGEDVVYRPSNATLLVFVLVTRGGVLGVADLAGPRAAGTGAARRVRRDRRVRQAPAPTR